MQEIWCMQKNSQQGPCRSRSIPNASDWPLAQQDWWRQQIFRITWSPQRLLANRNRQARSLQNSVNVERPMLPVHTPSNRSYFSWVDLFTLHSGSPSHCRIASPDNISSYIDDNLVHAKTFDKYILALEQLFIALRKFVPSLHQRWSSSIVNSKGFKADSEYVRAIREMKPPTSKKELQSFIGRLVWIRQFLETCLHEQIRYGMFSSLMSSIHELKSTNRSLGLKGSTRVSKKSRTDSLHHLSSRFWIFCSCSHSPLMLAMWRVELY